MTLVKYTTRQLLAKIPANKPFIAKDIDATGILENASAVGSAFTIMAHEKLIRKCRTEPIRMGSGARRNVWELTDLGRYHKQRGR